MRRPYARLRPYPPRRAIPVRDGRAQSGPPRERRRAASGGFLISNGGDRGGVGGLDILPSPWCAGMPKATGQSGEGWQEDKLYRYSPTCQWQPNWPYLGALVRGVTAVLANAPCSYNGCVSCHFSSLFFFVCHHVGVVSVGPMIVWPRDGDAAGVQRAIPTNS